VASEVAASCVSRIATAIAVVAITVVVPRLVIPFANRLVIASLSRHLHRDASSI